MVEIFNTLSLSNAIIILSVLLILLLLCQGNMNLIVGALVGALVVGRFGNAKQKSVMGGVDPTREALARQISELKSRISGTDLHIRTLYPKKADLEKQIIETNNKGMDVYDLQQKLIYLNNDIISKGRMSQTMKTQVSQLERQIENLYANEQEYEPPSLDGVSS